MNYFLNNKTINILYITHEYKTQISGGIGRVINGLSENINHLIDFDIFHIKKNLFRFDWDVHFYEIHHGKHKKKSYYSNYIDILKKVINSHNYTSIHILHCGRITVNCIKIIRKYFPNIKIIYSCHSIIKHEMNIRNNKQLALDQEEYIINNIDHIHLLNETSFRYLKQSYPAIIEKIPVSIIPNGIDENKYTKIKENWKRKIEKKIDKEKNTIVLCLSRWSYGKGLEILLDAIPIVAKDYPNIKFVIAGKKLISWENNFFKYKRMINKKIQNIKKLSLSLGWLNNVKRNTLFSIADITVMPSFLEYFPYSILEPMITKQPIISSDIDCVKEFLIKNRDCLSYNMYDPAELAEKIIYLIKNPQHRKVIAQNAYNIAKKQFHWERICRMYFTMYKNVHSFMKSSSINNRKFS